MKNMTNSKTTKVNCLAKRLIRSKMVENVQKSSKFVVYANNKSAISFENQKLFKRLFG